MASLLSSLGLRAAGPTDSAPALAPYYVLFNAVFSYIILAPRILKRRAGIDNNVSPRQNVATYGDAAVREGKLTRAQLDRIKRNEAAHANSMEHFAMLLGSVLFATHAGVSNETVNAAALIYSFARVAYGAAYLLVENLKWSQIRTILWWISTVDCLYLLWAAGRQMNSKP